MERGGFGFCLGGFRLGLRQQQPTLFYCTEFLALNNRLAMEIIHFLGRVLDGSIFVKNREIAPPPQAGEHSVSRVVEGPPPPPYTSQVSGGMR